MKTTIVYHEDGSVTIIEEKRGPTGCAQLLGSALIAIAALPLLLAVYVLAGMALGVAP